MICAHDRCCALQTGGRRKREPNRPCDQEEATDDTRYQEPGGQCQKCRALHGLPRGDECLGYDRAALLGELEERRETLERALLLILLHRDLVGRDHVPAEDAQQSRHGSRHIEQTLRPWTLAIRKNCQTRRKTTLVLLVELAQPSDDVALDVVEGSTEPRLPLREPVIGDCLDAFAGRHSNTSSARPPWWPPPPRPLLPPPIRALLPR